MTFRAAKNLVQIEALAVKALVRRIDKQFERAVKLILDCPGRVIVAGMGKTGIIGRKIAATLSSTGTPSVYMHSAEAAHGDLGQVTHDDVIVLISYSGETDETKRLIPVIKKIGAKIIAMTGEKKSTLGQYSDVVLDVSVDKEGCPLGLAPMASTTATLVMGDALAAELIVRKGFRHEDFAFYHPGGALGKRLLLKVEDIMRTGKNFARVKQTASVKDVLLAITRARCGSACIVDGRGHFCGFFTDGDLRRKIEEDPFLLRRRIKEVMNKKPTTISSDRLAAEAFQILKDRKFDELPVMDTHGHLVGLLDVQDLLKTGIV